METPQAQLPESEPTPAPSVEPAPDEIEALLRLYEQSVSDQQHYENQCASTANYIGLLALGAVGFIKLGEQLPILCILLSLFVIGLGWFGVSISRAHCYNRSCQAEAGKQYLTRIRQLLPHFPTPEQARATEDGDSEEGLKPSRSAWQIMHFGIILLGTILLISSLLHIYLKNLELFG